MKFLLFLIMTTLSLYGQSESASISGFVYDAGDREALIGANIFIKETLRGASTNLNGYFVIPKIEPGDYTLVCQYIGYKPYNATIHFKAGEQKTLNVYLEGDAIVAEEIVVTADSIPVVERLFRKPISKLELTGIEINQVPQVAESDLLRSLQTLPGISSVSDFSSALYVRGGTSDQNLYMIDGTDVYNPEHAFGLFSTFNTDAIKKVEISKGGFGAEYGGRLSSILNVTNLDGNREEFEGSGSISLLAARTTLQMPLGQFGSLSGSIRRTYFDKTIGQAVDEIPDYYFYDGNIKAFLQLNEKNYLTISGYGGKDVLNFIFNEKSDDKAGFDYNWGNSTGSIRWTRVFSPQLFANFWVTGSRFSSHFAFDDDLNLTEKNTINDITFKGNLEYYGKIWNVKFGFEQKNIQCRYYQSFPGGIFDVPAEPRQYTGYAQTNFKPTRRWDIEMGLRYDLFDTDKKYQSLDPRLSIKYQLNDASNVKFAAGRYHQYLHRVPRPFFVGVWTVSDQYQKGSSSDHFILGYQHQLAETYQFELETYYKNYNHIYQFNQNLATKVIATNKGTDNVTVFESTYGIFDHGKGYSYGFELMAKKEVGVVTGWVGYTFAKTRHKFEDINQEKSFAPRHDRSSTVNSVLTIDLKNAIRRMKGKPTQRDLSRWTIGTNFIFATGQPITVPNSTYFIGHTPDGGVDQHEFPTEINNYRLPAYARLDLSITYEKQFKTWSIAPYLQVFNIGNRKNVWFIEYDDQNQNGTVQRKIKTISMFPLLPTFGVNFKF
ncbi:TonB-dependent receptor [bacterium]|nr:TonB-dependent receptor [bacterium]